MKNRLILSLVLLFFALGLSAQDFEIVSVESLPADMSAREEMKTDHNDHQCALLRVATQNIAPNQREGFSFVPDLGSEVVERAIRDGEIWLWVSPGIKYLRIKHRDWGQYELRLQDYITRIEALHTYKLIINGKVANQDEKSASPMQNQVFQLSPTTSGYYNHHEYVDLGLPSGILWSTCNVGADVPEELGDCFAWGETQPKEVYDRNTYKYGVALYSHYNSTDQLTVLLPIDDAATANWGSDWRMPKYEEWTELFNNTNRAWTIHNGVEGWLFMASNGNSLFLPATGFWYESSRINAGVAGHYWSSSLNNKENFAWCVYFYPNECSVSGDYRSYGFSVRPVYSSSQP